MSTRPHVEFEPVHEHHPHAAEERCPLCKQILPQDVTLEDLEQRLRDQEQEAMKAQEKRLRAEFGEELATQREEAKKEAKRQAAKEAAEREKRIREEANAQAEKQYKDSIEKAAEQKRKAQEEKKVAEERIAKMKEEQDEQTNRTVQKALQEQREALDKAKEKEVQKLAAKKFEENQKLQQQVARLQRKLEQKSNDELGEGAEIDLYEALRETFEGDKIERIKKGEPGADIIHKVVHNGQVYGSIIYDSKNHKQWRTSFIIKLRQDQLAARADHAVLATSAFPAGANQLLVEDDVIVLNPARVVELVRIIREHIIQTHRLRLSTEERDKKTQALYEFINSERCRHLLGRSETIMDELLALDEKEMKAHQSTWKRRGQLIRDAQKVQADYKAEIDRIIEQDESAA